jgi:hypothetical protein
MFCLTSKRISETVSVKRPFEVSTSISIMHQLTAPNGRGKKLPEPKVLGSCIRLILLMLHPVTFLLGFLKREIAGFTANSPADILSEIRRIFQEI